MQNASHVTPISSSKLSYDLPISNQWIERTYCDDQTILAHRDIGDDIRRWTDDVESSITSQYSCIDLRHLVIIATAVGTRCRDVSIWNVASKNRTASRGHLISKQSSVNGHTIWRRGGDGIDDMKQGRSLYRLRCEVYVSSDRM